MTIGIWTLPTWADFNVRSLNQALKCVRLLPEPKKKKKTALAASDQMAGRPSRRTPPARAQNAQPSGGHRPQGAEVAG